MYIRYRWSKAFFLAIPGALLLIVNPLSVRGQTASDQQGATSPPSGHAVSKPYEEDKPEFKVSAAGMPPDVRQGYRLFREKCGGCHSLNRLRAKPDQSADEWADVIYRMQDMASSHMNNAESKAILRFAIWDDQARAKGDGGKDQKARQSP
ncbi:MAG TPA: hypothetical protein VH325_05460 [Bryobacteraceae bacterium]|jgi:mono/diheme cytochrome c family protein|nr:hypothetical protein [Bryobacteraceae bacterium]